MQNRKKVEAIVNMVLIVEIKELKPKIGVAIGRGALKKLRL
jgi:hypothetical protein